MLSRLIAWCRLDFAPRHRQPSTVALMIAIAGSIVGSLAVDALIVAVGQKVFPSTKGYVHFQFSDYSKLTVIGVVIACVAWPIVTRITSSPRWMFFRMAILVTLVLWLPDVYIWYRGQPGKAVGVLMVMHVAIALVTYNLLVRVSGVKALPRAQAAHRPLVPDGGYRGNGAPEGHRRY